MIFCAGYQLRYSESGSRISFGVSVNGTYRQILLLVDVLFRGLLLIQDQRCRTDDYKFFEQS